MMAWASDGPVVRVAFIDEIVAAKGAWSAALAVENARSCRNQRDGNGLPGEVTREDGSHGESLLSGLTALRMRPWCDGLPARMRGRWESSSRAIIDGFAVPHLGVKDETLAEDVSEVFLDVWRKARELQGAVLRIYVADRDRAPQGADRARSPLGDWAR